MAGHPGGMLDMLIAALLSLATYRATRFLLLDSLIDGWRNTLRAWLGSHRGLVWHKLFDLTDCPFCLSWWVAGALVGLTDIFTSVPLPILMWAAVAGGCMVVWRWVES